jgi:hypothetical protein
MRDPSPHRLVERPPASGRPGMRLDVAAALVATVTHRFDVAGTERVAA